MFYLMSIMMAPKSIFTWGPLLISAVMSLCMDFKKMLDVNPSTPILSINMVKTYVLKGASAQI